MPIGLETSRPREALVDFSNSKCDPPRLDEKERTPFANYGSGRLRRKLQHNDHIPTNKKSHGVFILCEEILMVSAQLKQKAADANFSPLTIRGIETDLSTRQTRIPADVLYQLLLFSPTPTAEEVLREIYLLECD
jgi:hypothetical protein